MCPCSLTSIITSTTPLLLSLLPSQASTTNTTTSLIPAHSQASTTITTISPFRAPSPNTTHFSSSRLLTCITFKGGRVHGKQQYVFGFCSTFRLHNHHMD
ncbi:hypothetical protein Pcinc_006399 [Petrolisthes cinctipes]|uniref:Secreted protein n=1 Tax=Petrolisthes cinctipes TaxID=88211 RepID=A0AAE1GD82_PETCI|nr:hypothetical protein Pcinc_006399 [Petrolisthes cinctipes]